MRDDVLVKTLRLTAWRQYYDVNLVFHPQLTVVTGANGAGKTTILNLIGMFYGWDVPLVSTPRTSRLAGGIEYFGGALEALWNRLRPKQNSSLVKVGSIEFTDGSKSDFLLPPAMSPTFKLQLSHGVPLAGLNIPSHRSVYSYSSADMIPTNPPTRRHLFDMYHNPVRMRYRNQPSEAPGSTLKRNLMALAVFGHGNEAVEGNPAALQIFRGFEHLLRLLLPPKIGFKRITIRNPEVVLETTSGDFSLDGISGGIASVIDIAWQIYTYDSGEPFVVTFDEPENHLHPELQVRLLPSLLAAFPRAQFIVATHNPLMVGSVPDAAVYALRYNADQLVESVSLDLKDKAATANDVLRDVLGLPFTVPIWAAERLDEIITRFRERQVTKDSLRELRAELSRAGMSDLIPSAVASVLDNDAELP